MASTATAIPSEGSSDGGGGGDGGSLSLLRASFEDLERQKSLITTCTLLWRELTDHFTSLERDLQIKSDAHRSRLHALDRDTQRSLEYLHHREQSIDGSVALAIAKADERRDAALAAIQGGGAGPADGGEQDMAARLRVLCTRMDFDGFWDLLISKRKEADAVRGDLPSVLSECVDPAKFVMEAMSKVFPVDKRGENGKGAGDLGWACLMILESLIPVLADPELGSARPFITPSIREPAKEVADTWKGGLEQRGGVESAKAPDVHTFLQHVITFGVVMKEDKELYRKLVLCSSRRKQMPKIAVSLGLGDIMTAIRKEQSALRAVIKCIKDRKLEPEFPPESLQKQLEQLEEKPKVEKKRPVSTPANKRTRANSGGPMPPAKAGRLTSHAHVSSFPAAGTFIRSPSAHTPYQAPVSPYAYDRIAGPGLCGSQSPQSIRDPYAYTQEVAPAPLGVSYFSRPVNYPMYGGYSAQPYQQAYYR